jgi:N-acetylmuramoyl-L-alanine amidase
MRFHSGARGASFAANGLRFFRHATLSFFISVCAHSARPSEIGEIAEIAVDVGHTPEAFGAISARGVREFDLNRELAAKTIRALEKLKLKTRRINFDGRVGGIDARPKQAAGANFFLSIHHDSVQPELLEEWEWKGEKRTYSDRHAGFSLFVSRNNPDPVTSLRCASAIGARLRRNGFVPATHHADSIAGTPRPWADRTNAVHFYDTLIVLYRTMLPAVLLEAGVIKHRAEEMALRDPRQQTLMADALATGIAACLYVRAAPER